MSSHVEIEAKQNLNAIGPPATMADADDELRHPA